MNATFAKGLAEEWLRRCNALATKYQLDESIDLQTGVEELVRGALQQHAALGADGVSFLTTLRGRLVLTAGLAEMPEPALPNKLSDPKLNIAARSKALRTVISELENATTETNRAA